MGMATIKEHLGKGLFRCTYRHGTARLKEELKQLDVQLTLLDTAITKKNTEITTQENALTNALNVLDAAIAAEDTAAGQAAVATVGRARNLLNFLKLDLERLEAERAEARLRKRELESLKTEFERDLWIADHSLNVQTDDARPAPTAEIPGESFEIILLPAGDEDTTPTFNLANHGAMLPLEVMDGPERYYNAAMLAGWQKYVPGYRIGRVDKKNADGTMDLTLIGPNRSSQQDLTVTPTTPHDDTEPEYKSVPVKYLTCDARAFRLDDEVLIEYQQHDALQPRVIGFRNNPRSCDLTGFIFTTGVLVREGASSGDWNFTETDSFAFGTVYWQGAARNLSWDGMGAWFTGFPTEGTADNFWSRLTTVVYRNNKAIVTNAPGLVLGAGISGTVEDGSELIIVAVLPASQAVLDGGGRPPNVTIEFYRKPFVEPENTDVPWVAMGSYAKAETAGIRSTAQGFVWFNGDATRAVYMQAGGKVLDGIGTTGIPFTTNSFWQYPVEFTFSGGSVSAAEEGNGLITETTNISNPAPPPPSPDDAGVGATDSSDETSGTSGNYVITQGYIGQTKKKAQVFTSGASVGHVDFVVPPTSPPLIWLATDSTFSSSLTTTFSLEGGTLSFISSSVVQSVLGESIAPSVLINKITTNKTTVSRAVQHLNIAQEAAVVVKTTSVVLQIVEDSIFTTDTEEITTVLEIYSGGVLIHTRNI